MSENANGIVQYMTFVSVLNLIDDMPTVATYCKECKYCIPVNDNDKEWLECRLHKAKTFENNICDMGKNKDD